MGLIQFSPYANLLMTLRKSANSFWTYCVIVEKDEISNVVETLKSGLGDMFVKLDSIEMFAKEGSSFFRGPANVVEVDGRSVYERKPQTWLKGTSAYFLHDIDKTISDLDDDKFEIYFRSLSALSSSVYSENTFSDVYPIKKGVLFGLITEESYRKMLERFKLIGIPPPFRSILDERKRFLRHEDSHDVYLDIGSNTELQVERRDPI